MTIEVFNHMTGGGPLELTVLKDGRQVLAARIAPGAFGPAVIALTPTQAPGTSASTGCSGAASSSASRSRWRSRTGDRA